MYKLFFSWFYWLFLNFRYIFHNYTSMEVHSYSYESFLSKDLAFQWPQESRPALKIVQVQHSWVLERPTCFSAFLKPRSFLQCNLGVAKDNAWPLFWEPGVAIPSLGWARARATSGCPQCCSSWRPSMELPCLALDWNALTSIRTGGRRWIFENRRRLNMASECDLFRNH